MRSRHNGSIVYRYKDAVYLNVTNRCPTACAFCIKRDWGMRYRGTDLRLGGDPGAREILDAFGPRRSCAEAVYCGYGESTYRLDTMMLTAPVLRRRGVRRLRLNTVGLGSLIHGRDIAPELAAIVDAVHVSLNTADASEWRSLHRPLPEFRRKGFGGVLEFVRSCVRQGIETTVTAVELPDADLDAVQDLASRLGARFRVRPALDPQAELLRPGKFPTGGHLELQ